jgi:hypothetical protein
MGEDVPVSIAQKASEQISDPARIKQAKKIRQAESEKREQERKDFFGE